jgi:hypothetical protein
VFILPVAIATHEPEFSRALPKDFSPELTTIVFVFCFPQRSLLPLECFVFAGQLRGSHSLLSVPRARFGFLGLVPAWSAPISAPQFLSAVGSVFRFGSR